MVEAAILGDDKAWTGPAGVAKEENWTIEVRLGDGEAMAGGIGVENSTLVVSARLVAEVARAKHCLLVKQKAQVQQKLLERKLI